MYAVPVGRSNEIHVYTDAEVERELTLKCWYSVGGVALPFHQRKDIWAEIAEEEAVIELSLDDVVVM